VIACVFSNKNIRRISAMKEQDCPMLRNNHILLSVVIPVYNVEKYLSECLDSIFDPAVDASLYEVIAVDDGSTDNSPAILEAYKKHENFRVLNQDNQGASVARNVGIKQARGKYIFFIDSDDYLLPGAISTALRYASSSDCEIVKFDFILWRESAGEFAEIKGSMARVQGIMDGKEAFSRGYGLNPISKLLRRDYLLDHKLFFYPGIIFEDLEWTPRSLFHAKKVEYCPIQLYVYRIRPNSVMTSRKGKKECLDSLTIALRLAEFRESIEPSPENAQFRKELGNTIVYSVKTAIRQMYKFVPADERREILEKINECRHLLAHGTGVKKKLRYYLTRYLPAGFACDIYNLSR